MNAELYGCLAAIVVLVGGLICIAAEWDETLWERDLFKALDKTAAEMLDAANKRILKLTQKE